MKTFFTLCFAFKRATLTIITLVVCLTAFCQPDYDFRNATLISGTDKEINAVYLFQNVKPGVDATVTINDITGGIKLNNVDGGSGYKEALQPVLQVPALSSGYVEFQIDFLVAGTSIPMVQTEVPVTPIDVDGQTYSDGVVNEFDMLPITNGYVDYDMLGGQLNLNLDPLWATGINISGIDYPGVDTTPRQVMFTTVNAGISTFIFRTGATSLALGSHQRLRSLYFQKFAYPNAFLPLPSLLSFSGTALEEKTVLQWNMQTGNLLDDAVVERASNPAQFTAIGNVYMTTGNKINNTYSFTDPGAVAATTYYRLKMTDAGKKTVYSNILVFHPSAKTKQPFAVYPAAINDNATVKITAVKAEQTCLQLFDMNGRIMYQKSISLQAGNNSIPLNGLGSLQQGIYAAAVKTGNNTYSQKIVIQ